VHLTPAGEEVVRNVRDVGTVIEEKIHACLTPREQDFLEEMLRRLKDNLLSFDSPPEKDRLD
jgi:DNA-binding MarR family transcriptional regulator